jgi:hypothetical protein
MNIFCKTTTLFKNVSSRAEIHPEVSDQLIGTQKNPPFVLLRTSRFQNCKLALVTICTLNSYSRKPHFALKMGQLIRPSVEIRLNLIHGEKKLCEPPKDL